MSDSLDRNLRKLLGLAPPPEAPPANAADRSFNRAYARLSQYPNPPRKVRWVVWGAALAASLLLAVGIWSVRHRAPAPVAGPTPGPPVPSPTTPEPELATVPSPQVPREAPQAPEVTREIPQAAAVPRGTAQTPEVMQIAPPLGLRSVHTLQDGSTLEVADGSKVTVTSWPDRPRPLVELLSGEVLCRVAKGPGTFRVKTFVGEASALGTEYKVRLDEKAAETEGPAAGGGGNMTRQGMASVVMTVAVLGGQVLVSGPDGFSRLAVAGESVSVAKTKAPPENFRSGQLVPRLADGRQGEPLEVRKHEVSVTIRDQVVLVEVDQVFFNPSGDRLEGTFHFPLPNGAAICRLAMYVGDNLMEGEIAEAARARRTFEALKVMRVDPALLEWAGGNNFKMRVFPIEPKSEKRVLLSYYQVLEKENDRLLFTYPLVSEALQTHPIGKIEIKAALDFTPDITTVTTQGYETKMKIEKHHVEASYAAEKATPVKDFQIEVALARGQGELVALPFWKSADGNGYFLMIFSPELEALDSNRGAGSRFVFVVDKSGGLGTRYFSLAVKTVETALGLLRAGDQFGLVAYDTFAQTFRPALVANTPQNVQAAVAWLKGLQAVGASDLSEAWGAAATLAGAEPTQVLYAGAGLSSLTSTRSGKLLQEADAAFAHAKVRIHCLPLGTIQDAGFLGDLARKYGGTLRFVNGADDVYPRVSELMLDYGAPLYADVKVAVEGVTVDDVYPQALPNVAAGRQLFLFGKYLGQGQAKVKLTAQYKDRPYDKEFTVSFGAGEVNTCVPPLWATRKIEHLQRELSFASGDASQNMVRTVVETSKRYTVMSQYTSFLVLETPEDYVRYGIERRVREFGPYAGTGGSAAEQLQAVEYSAGANAARSYGRRGAAPGKGGADGEAVDRARAEGEPATKRALRRAGADKSDDAGAEPEFLAEGKDLQAQEPLAQKFKANGRPGADSAAAERAAAAPPPAPSLAAAKAPSYDGTPRDEKQAEYRKKVSGDFGEEGKASPRANGLKRSASSEFETDALAWSRTDIFPTIPPAGPDYVQHWPGGWRHSPAEALDLFRAVSGRFQTLTCKVTAYRLDKDGKEVKEGREWEVACDVAAGRYLSYRAGEDTKDVCDGKRLVRYFPLLKYAATRRTEPQDLRAFLASLPGFLCPWAENLDWQYVVSIEKRGPDGVVLKLAQRNDQWTYVNLFLESEKGPVTRIEYYQHRTAQKNQNTSVLTQTVICEDLKEIGGVRMALAFRTIVIPGGTARNPDELPLLLDRIAKLRAAGQLDMARKMEEKMAASGMVAPPQTSQLIRLSDVQVNGKLEPGVFAIKIPADWAVRDLDAQPKPADCRSLSTPLNPSLNNFGRQPGRFPGRGRGFE